jgi:predicted HTH domain antitoxin
MATRRIFLEIPDKVLLAEKMDEESLKLYEMGRLSSGRAAELAGLSRVEFLLNMERYRVFPLQHELQELEKAHH